MEEWKPLNMELRSWVIGQVLRLEQASSTAIKAILRVFADNSKTLGNQSSALSFKSKIDLLFDLEEITKKEYSHLLKLMEIRNQFAHNPYVSSFEDLDLFNREINKYLTKHAPLETGADVDRENKLKASFLEIFKISVGKLLIIGLEYQNGIEKELRKHINNEVVKNIDQIWKQALQKNKEKKNSAISLLSTGENNTDLNSFYFDFRVAMSQFAEQEIDKLGLSQIKDVLKPKKTLEESLVEIKEKRKSKSNNCIQ